MSKKKDNETKNIPLVKAEEAVQDTEYLQQILSAMDTKFEAELELAQGRSNFQIEKFVALGNYTLSATYKHILKNAKIMRGELFRVIREGIEFKREFEYKWREKDTTDPVWWKTKDGGEKLCWYDTDQFEYHVYMKELAISIKDKVQQLAFFDKMMEELEKKNGGPITREQFDSEEPEYWKTRFLEQIHDEYIHKLTGIGVGNIRSARSAQAPTILPNSINKTEALPSMDNPELFITEARKNVENAWNKFTSNNQLTYDKDSDVLTINKHPSEEIIVDDNDYFKNSMTMEDIGISVKKDTR